MNGSSNCKRFESTATFTCILLPSAAGAWKPASSTAKPFGGSSNPVGSFNKTSSPLSFFNLSFNGLKLSVPAIANAVTNSGEPTKA